MNIGQPLTIKQLQKKNASTWEAFCDASKN